MDVLTHALTIHQPYAWAVAAGHKPVENRTWRPPLEMVGKLIGIHASARPHPDFGSTLLTWDRQRVGIPRQEDGEWVSGALIGVARLVGVVRQTKDGTGYALEHGRGEVLNERLSDAQAAAIRPWTRPGHIWWYLREAVLLPEPIPMRGQQGLWRITEGERMAKDGTIWAAGAAVWALSQWRKARETQR